MKEADSNKKNVRITSGFYRGQTISTPGGKTHPMGERERLALFNILSDEVVGATVLDAFAGSGALGIEALSRGALKVVFVEKNRDACKIIRENLEKIGLKQEVICQDVSLIGEASGSFDLILADPPYDDFVLADVINLTKNLKNEGIMVLSHPGEAPEIPELKLLKTYKYAAARLSFYRKQSS